MKKIMVTASVLAIGAGAAHAGGIERMGNPYSMLWDKGNQLQLSFSSVKPNVEGDYPTALGGGSTDNMAGGYNTLGVAYKQQINDKLAFGLFLNTPYGANASYPTGAYTGLKADWDSNQIAAVAKYQINERVSVYGGLRYVRSTADITIPDQLIRKGVADGAAQAQAGADALTAAYGATDPRTVAVQTQAQTLAAIASTPFGTLQYDARGDEEGDLGYILGAAYEIPDIALRVSLTWESSITHEYDTHEVLPGFAIDDDTKTKIEMPQSFTLDFQTGVAKDTLVFGKVKWTEWSKWEVRTPKYEEVTGDRVTGLDDDVITYQLGVGRRFSDELSGFARVTYEKGNGGEASRLAPTDGSIAFGVGGAYTDGKATFRAGVEYVKLGDAEDASGVDFSDNTAVGIGASLTFSF